MKKLGALCPNVKKCCTTKNLVDLGQNVWFQQDGATTHTANGSIKCSQRTVPRPFGFAS